MNARRIGFASLLVLLSARLPALPASASPRIPMVHGAVLSGEKVDLPGDLKGGAGVLVVGFSQQSREQVTEWGKRLAQDRLDEQVHTAGSRIRYYEMADLAGVPRLLRGLVLGKLKGSISATGQRTFFAVTDHDQEWKTAATFRNPENAYVLLIDESGIVRWQTEGAVTDRTYAMLRSQIAQVVPQ